MNTSKRYQYTVSFDGEILACVASHSRMTPNQVRGVAIAQHQRVPLVHPTHAPFEVESRIRVGKVREYDLQKERGES